LSRPTLNVDLVPIPGCRRRPDRVRLTRSGRRRNRRLGSATRPLRHGAWRGEIVLEAFGDRIEALHTKAALAAIDPRLPGAAVARRLDPGTVPTSTRYAHAPNSPTRKARPPSPNLNTPRAKPAHQGNPPHPRRRDFRARERRLPPAAGARLISLINFRCESVYLPEQCLEQQSKFHPYAIGTRKLPDLRALRATYPGTRDPFLRG
jgi:hypothetical protein